MLEVKNVTKRYGKNVACNDVSFTLEPGSLTVLLGPNGAGKSTIIKSIIGFLKYDGSITINGMNNKSVEARKVLGYIPEMPSLYPTLTVIEHMEFIARAYKLTDYKDRINMLLERFELDDKRNTKTVSTCCLRDSSLMTSARSSVTSFPKVCSRN